jgi:ankyrin repeat protein
MSSIHMSAYVCHPYVVRRLYPGWAKEQAEKMLASILFNREAEQAQKDGFHSVDPDHHLLYAARFGLNDEIRAAFAHGANSNAQWRSRWTPLLLAVTYGHAQTVQLLITLGADVSFANDYQETALDLAKLQHHNQIMGMLETPK